MLTRSWGSCRTTTTLMSPTKKVRNAECGVRSVKMGVAGRTTLPGDSAFRTPHSALSSSHQLQHAEPLRLLPISPQPHPSVATAPDELSRTPLAAGEDRVNGKVEADLAADVGAMPFRPRDRESNAVALLGAPPGAVDRAGRSRPRSRTAPAPAASVSLPPSPSPSPLGHYQKAGDVAAFQVAEVELDAIRADVVRLVIEPQRRRSGGAEAQVGLRHLDREVERLVIPTDVSDRGKVLGPGVRLLAAAILVLELESQRLAGIESVARAVECRRPIDAQRRRDRRFGGIELDQWLKRGLGIPRSGESYARRSSGDLPARRGRVARAPSHTGRCARARAAGRTVRACRSPATPAPRRGAALLLTERAPSAVGYRLSARGLSVPSSRERSAVPAT